MKNRRAEPAGGLAPLLLVGFLLDLGWYAAAFTLLPATRPGPLTVVTPIVTNRRQGIRETAPWFRILTANARRDSVHYNSDAEEEETEFVTDPLREASSSRSSEQSGDLRRRQVLFGAALSGVLLGQSQPAWTAAATTADPSATTTSFKDDPQTILITGANSGIGLEACRRLVSAGHDIVLACRTLEKAEQAADELLSATNGIGTAMGRLLPGECDLADLESIRRFAQDQLPQLLVNKKLDVLCLNAGLARNTAASDVARTADGFELTVGVNHFGHFYLNHLCLPLLANSATASGSSATAAVAGAAATGKSSNKKQPRIVVTASGVHDPASPGGSQGIPADLGQLGGLEQQGKACEMIDGGDFNADKAYKDSKLCNVLFTRELQRRLKASDKYSSIAVNCFNPGLIVGTGFFRDQNPVFTKLFDLAATDLLKVGETPRYGGGCLSYMATDITTQGLYYSSPPGSVKYGDAAYGNQFRPETPSHEARDDAKASRLFDLSARLLGVQSEVPPSEQS